MEAQEVVALLEQRFDPGPSPGESPNGWDLSGRGITEARELREFKVEVRFLPA